MRPLNTYITYTLLTPHAKQEEFEDMLDVAIGHQLSSVLVAPYMCIPIKHIMNFQGYPTKIGTTIGANGDIPLELKLKEAEYFSKEKIDEIEFVVNHAEIKNKKFNYVMHEIRTLANVCKSEGAVVKCVVNSSSLTMSELDLIFHYVQDYAPHIDYIKNIGYSTPNAKDIDILSGWNDLRGNSPGPLIEFSGWIPDSEFAKKLIDSGVDKLGINAGASFEGWFDTSQKEIAVLV